MPAKRARVSTPTKSPPKRTPQKRESKKKGKKEADEAEVEEESKETVNVPTTRKRRASSKEILSSPVSITENTDGKEVKTRTGSLTSLEIQRVERAPVLGRTLSMHHSARVESVVANYDEDGGTLHMEGDFVAVHTNEAPFWLAQLEEPITVKTAPDDLLAVVWLEHVHDDEYATGVEDRICAGAVMMGVAMNVRARPTKREPTFFLDEDSKSDLLAHLERQARFDLGQTGEIEAGEAAEAEETKEEGVRAPRSSKKKASNKKKAKPAVDIEQGEESQDLEEEEERPKLKRKSRAKKSEGDEEKKTSKKMGKRTPSTKPRKGKLKLDPNPAIPLLLDSFLQKGPFRSFEGDNQRASKEVLRALLSAERELLEKLVHNATLVYTIHASRSVNCPFTALQYAIIRNDEAAIRLFVPYLSGANRGPVDQTVPRLQHVTLTVMNTGNHTSRFSKRNRRAVQASRGGMEGNNALTKELQSRQYPNLNVSEWQLSEPVLTALCEPGVTLETLQLIMTLLPSISFDNAVVYFVRHGRLQLAAYLVGILVKNEGHGFNKLHEQVLKNRNEPLEKFLKVSVGKKPVANACIRPTHCAAINPNGAYLKSLLDIDPSLLRINDDERVTLMHYAAVCSGTGPLKVLLAQGLSYSEPNAEGETPIMWAASHNRPDNIRELIKAASAVAPPVTVDPIEPATEEQKRGEQDSEMREGDGEAEEKEEAKVAEDLPMSEDARKMALLKEKNPEGLTALHYASRAGHVECVKVLIEAGAEIECKTAALPRNSFTPFLFACQQGHLEVVKALEKLGANLASVDKLNKTGLVVATQEGHIHVVSYLLRAGVNPNIPDSSGNAAAHYAAAYGWDDILALLVQGGGELNQTNTWKLSPLGAAVGLGRFACVDWLLNHEIDVNEKDATGKTLLIDLCGTLGQHNTLTVIKKLLEHKGLDVNLQDSEGASALHALAKTSSTLALETAQLLLERKADVRLLNTAGESPLVLAVRSQQIELGKLLLSAGSKLKGEDQHGKNFLHHLMSLAVTTDVQPLVDLVRKESEEEFLAFAHTIDDQGFTPLLLLLKQLSQWTKSYYHQEDILPRVKLLISSFPAETRTATVKLLKPARTDPKVAPQWSAEGGYSMAHFMATSVSDEVSQALCDLLLENPETGNERFLNIQDACGFTALHKGIQTNRLKSSSVGKIIEKNAAINTYSLAIENNTPLHCAILSQDLSLVILLLEAKATVNICDGLQRTPLHLAVILENISLSQILLDHRADVHCVDEEKRTPLHFAVNNCTSSADASFEMEKLLLAYGANANVKDIYQRFPLHYALLKMDVLDGQIPLKKKIRQTNQSTLYTHKFKKQHYGTSAVQQHDPIETVSSLCSIKGLLIEADENQNTPIHFACKVGATACFSYLIKRGQGDELEKLDRDGNTPLGLALMNKQPNFAIMLIQKGPNVNAPIYIVTRNTQERDEETHRKAHSMFYEAILNGWQGVAYLLLDAGYSYLNAIQDALVAEKFQLVLTLLSKLHNEDMNVCDEEKNSLLHYLAKTRSTTAANFDSSFSVKIAQVLVEKGINIKHKANDLRTALHWAVFYVHPNLVAFLLQKGVSPRDIDNQNQSPLSLLMQSANKHSIPDEKTADGFFSIARNLISSKADIDYVYPEMFKLSGKLKHNKTRTTTALIRAIRLKKLVLFGFLLTSGAALHIQDSEGRSPLAHAVMANNQWLVNRLLSLAQEQKQQITHAVDKNGKSLVHLCVSPTSYSSDENISLLQLLISSGCPVNHLDNQGNPPLYYAMQQESGVMKNQLMKLGAQECPAPLRRQASGIFHWPIPEVDFESDALTMRGKLEAEGSEKKKHVPPPVNSCIDLPQNKRVLEDAEGDDDESMKVVEEKKEEEKTKEGVKKREKKYFDCLLTHVNLKHGSHGENEFYKMQIVQDNISKLFILITNWGRVGEQGKFQQTPFSDKQLAINDFKKIFKSKTGNVWNVVPFTKVAKKYLLKESERMEYISADVIKGLLSPSEEEKKRKEGFLADTVTSSLPIEMQRTVFMLTDVAMMNAASRSGGVDLPLGRLKKETLEKASATLLHIKTCLAKIEELRTAIPLDAAAVLAEAEKLADLSSTYYELIPRQEYNHEPIRPLNQSDLQTQSNLLASLMNLEIAAKVVLAAQLNPSKIHPLDYCLKALDVNLEPLQPNEGEFKAIMKYSRLKHTHHVEVENIYRLQRQGEASQMIKWKDAPNHYLLWHGTKAFNVVGILRQGLRVAPPEAPTTGYMFGKGIYFADMLEKSLPYCGSVHGPSRGFIFLCEVALGAMHELTQAEYMEKAHDGFTSTKGVGAKQPNPEETIVLSNGVMAPLGEPEERTAIHPPLALSYNEFIVYDPTQVRIRYMIQLKQAGHSAEIVVPVHVAEDQNESHNDGSDSEEE